MEKIRSLLFSFLFIMVVITSTGAVVVYTETFDDGTCSSQATEPPVCWCTSTCCDIPISSSTPLCMSGRALRTNSSTIDPTIGIDLRNCTGTATMTYTYYQFAFANITVQKTTQSSGTMNCDSPPTFSYYGTVPTTGSCTSASVTLTAGVINYIRFDHPSNSNAFYIDNVSIDATCAEPACATTFSSNFGTTFQSGTVCAIFPSLWENCQGNGPYITSSAPCGGTGDYAMALGTGYPYSCADTICLDLTGLTSATLSYYYYWDGLGSPVLSPKIQVSVDGGAFSDLKSSHDNTSGACVFVCLDLAAYIGNDHVQFKFTSQSSSTTEHAYFDDITLNRNATCPSTPTPTQITTATPTQLPSTTPTITPTVTSTETPTEMPSDTPTQTPTEVPTEVPTETPTMLPTETPTEMPSDTPTQTPTEVPTEVPTETPTEMPSDTPTQTPTETMTVPPTNTSPSTPAPIPSTSTEGIGIILGVFTVILLYQVILKR